ncbi:MFS transporter [Teredinibacter turnerae]|uniref:MFS transporter n=1 Tax=Teredinibacter turnerae TaxID=2426 RepID=UPI00037B49F0|nr:MFS transporter [Teredinibacter turnerae]
MHPISAILGSVALLLLGGGLLNTLITLTGNDYGFSKTMLGLIMSGYFAGFTCGTFVSGRLIQRIGHIRSFAFCAALCGSVALLHYLWVNAWAWLVLRFVYGLAFVTLVTVIESWLNTRAQKEDRGKVFAAYMVVNLGAIAVAQQLLRLDTEEAFTAFAIAAIFICWAVLPITITSRSQPHIPEKASSSLRKLLKFAPLPVASALLSGLAMGAFWSMTPLFAQEQGFSRGDIGLLMSMTIVGGALFQLPVGRYSDKHDRRKVLLTLCIAASLLMLITTFATGLTSLIALYFLWGGFSFALYPIAVALLIDQLHPDEVISGTTDMLVLHGAGAALAPLLAGSLMNAFGVHALPAYVAAVLLVLGCYAVLQIRRVSVLPAGENAHFEPMVQTSAEVLEMISKEESEPEHEEARAEEAKQ